nr:hypothetical protein [Tanacetum cinerariifolium]
MVGLLKRPLVVQTGYAFLNKISENVGRPLYVILQLEPEKLAHPVNFLALRDARVSPHIVKESTVTPASESSEFPPNVFHTSFVIALEQNEEWMNVIVDWSDLEMTNGATHAKSGNSFMQGTSYVLDDVAKVIMVGSKRVSSGLGNVVVALSIGEKVDGLLPSSAADEEATSNPSGLLYVPSTTLLFIRVVCFEGGDHCVSSSVLKFSWFDFSFPYVFRVYGLLFTSYLGAALSTSTDGLVLIPTETSWLRNSSFMVANPVNTSALEFKIFGRCVIRNFWNGVTCKSFIPLLTKATSPANNASQSMAWSDTLNFKRMAYECIFSLGLTRITPTPKPSLIASFPRDSSASFIYPDSVAASSLMRTLLMRKHLYGYSIDDGSSSPSSGKGYCIGDPFGVLNLSDRPFLQPMEHHFFQYMPSVWCNGSSLMDHRLGERVYLWFMLHDESRHFLFTLMPLYLLPRTLHPFQLPAFPQSFSACLHCHDSLVSREFDHRMDGRAYRSEASHFGPSYYDVVRRMTFYYCKLH